MKIFYSAEHNGFFSDAIAYNPTPVDLVEVSQEMHEEFMLGRNGKIMQPGLDGLPSWADIPPLTAEQQLEMAERKKSTLRTIADAEIAWRQDAVDAGIATEKETAALSEWKKYRVLLMRVDTSKPDWPTPPVEQAS
ncbi:tail fiber assembly protein [Citrobacter sp. RHBSTW-00678]|uniref:tail fiber assembly protein n=1 Tax=unclassified Citrobacter TaxID=2644389 RepID=UPI0015EA041F|nr:MULTISPECIES: tail fiber assembly protein [unclassified Citrobacter]MBA8056659.1 tail fiber assembly protein [Citrobacter sp. RHBSTW-00104]QLV86138.1 tail fiber assembly protein [Citrobacter sp. RHBSTW-00678]QMA16731.1 tail fiber assembly protein [Citrobacter sp. RHBSTW-00053]